MGEPAPPLEAACYVGLMLASSVERWLHAAPPERADVVRWRRFFALRVYDASRTRHHSFQVCEDHVREWFAPLHALLAERGAFRAVPVPCSLLPHDEYIRACTEIYKHEFPVTANRVDPRGRGDMDHLFLLAYCDRVAEFDATAIVGRMLTFLVWQGLVSDAWKHGMADMVLRLDAVRDDYTELWHLSNIMKRRLDPRAAKLPAGGGCINYSCGVVTQQDV